MFKNKSKILKSIKFFAIVIIFVVGISYLGFKNSEKSFASTGGGGGGTLSGCATQGSVGTGICTPLDEGIAPEAKLGGLSVGAFVGGTSGSSSQISGTTYVSNNLVVPGNNLTTGTVIVGSLSGTGTRQVCATGSGQLYICGTTPPTPINISTQSD